ncbi:MAG: hypothetical protein OEP48_06080 [Betaproteobacteria bacterium]|nr:hypothetical protein [Betaproteobacteria bacterium]MDH3438210.1 hypothetical protein [Betaproteobacteria bacterium]
MRYRLIAFMMLLCSVTAANAQVSINIRLPSASIGINVPVYPELVPVPGYPVYYAPHLSSNFFFYDGLYWVYQWDNWYASSWYNGPWGLVAPEVVPFFVLRIPVGYYRNPPAYFHRWRRDAPPRWGVRWGHRWERHRRGWDRWDRRAVVAPAPLPLYQRHYSRNQYPRYERQRALHNRNYRHEPHDAVVRQHYREQTVHRAPARASRDSNAAGRHARPAPQMAAPPRSQGARKPQRGVPQAQREAPRAQDAEPARQPRFVRPQDNDEPHRSQNQGQRQNRRDRGDDRGQERGR